MNYYNEFDKNIAAWLRELIKHKQIPDGYVDERSIVDVSPKDLDGFLQCHFFAGISGWSYGLQLAGWPEDKPVWTGSPPCQPFSVAGKRKGVEDERHLWPAFRWLIAQCKPSVVFGEQVASKDGRDWLAGVCTDLETLGYQVGAADLCAAGVGAPHIRQRLWWVADFDCDTEDSDTGDNEESFKGTAKCRAQQCPSTPRGTSGDGGMDDTNTDQHNEVGRGDRETGGIPEINRQEICRGESCGTSRESDGGVADSHSMRRRKRNKPSKGQGEEAVERSGTVDGGVGNAKCGSQGCSHGGTCGQSGVGMSDQCEGNKIRDDIGDHVSDSGMADSKCEGSQGGLRGGADSGRQDQHGHIGCSSTTVWHPCKDGKTRRIPFKSCIFLKHYGLSIILGDDWLEGVTETEEQIRRIQRGVEEIGGGMMTLFPLCKAVPGSAILLKGAGNAIVPQVAAIFIKSFMERDTEGAKVNIPQMQLEMF